jgi:predicted outer membrane repeat protein
MVMDVNVQNINFLGNVARSERNGGAWSEKYCGKRIFDAFDARERTNKG